MGHCHRPQILETGGNELEHFSPNFLFRNATFAGAANRHGNNRSAWEAYHQRAIKEAQAIGAAAGSVSSSPLLPLEVPLITNAFGDHFLTDAFSAGHVINKDAIVEFWKTMFFTGASLLPEAKAFFKRLAEAAFARGDVRAKIQRAGNRGNILPVLSPQHQQRGPLCIGAVWHRREGTGPDWQYGG